MENVLLRMGGGGQRESGHRRISCPFVATKYRIFAHLMAKPGAEQKQIQPRDNVGKGGFESKKVSTLHGTVLGAIIGGKESKARRNERGGVNPNNPDGY